MKSEFPSSVSSEFGDEDIVISGMSLRLPNANSVQEFSDNLYNKANCTTDVTARYGHSVHNEIPKFMGLLKSVNEFDAGFFGISAKESHYMDPMCRIVLECTYEAILDAGMSPSDFEGKKTVIYIGASTFENENLFYSGEVPKGTCCIVESVRSVIGERLNYWLKTTGKTQVADSACASSMFSLEHAFKRLKNEDYEYAIIAGANLCLNEMITMQFSRLGVLSKDGVCKAFDDSANGYVRSEGIVVSILQKAKTAKRIYGKVIYAKLNCDGYKSHGITFPSSEAQTVLLSEFYKECQVDPSTITYVEAHGTGTHIGDPEELNSIDEVFCAGRKRVLPIGSVKSNIGHNEPTAGLCGVVKVLIGFHTGLIPPNINYTNPRKSVKALLEKRMVVVTDPMEWPEENAVVGVSSFGFGGANGHTLLSRYSKTKIHEGIPEDDLPRLVAISGRTQESVLSILKDLASRNLDQEYVGLYHNIFRKPHYLNRDRGYAILFKDSSLNQYETSICEYSEKFAMYFGAENPILPQSLKALQEIQIVSRKLQEIQAALDENHIQFRIQTLLETFDAENTFHSIFGTVVTQICLSELLVTLKVEFCKIFGVGIGILAAQYHARKLSLKQVTAIAFKIKEAYSKQHLGLDKNKFTTKLRSFLNNLGVADTESVLDNLLGNTMNDLKVAEETIVVGCGTYMHEIHERECVNLLDASECVLTSFLTQLGRLYNSGCQLDFSAMYPRVNFPVSRETPMIASLIKWNHARYYADLTDRKQQEMKKYKTFVIEPNQMDWAYIQGHVIDGRNLFPATGFLYCVWELFASIHHKTLKEVSVVFENVKFIRAVNLPKDGQVSLYVSLFLDSGEFEVCEGDMTMVSGKIFKYQDGNGQISLPFTINEELPLKTKDIYKELRLRSYNYSGAFKGLKECNVNATIAKVEWKDNWVAFLDNLLQLLILKEDTRSLYVPTGIQRLTIDPKSHFDKILQEGDESFIPVSVHHEAELIRAGGVELLGLHASAISKRKPRGEPVLEANRFVPNIGKLEAIESVRVNMQLILENVSTIKVKCFEIFEKSLLLPDLEPLSPYVLDALGDIPLIQPELTVFCKEPIELENISIEDGPFAMDENVLLVISNNLLQNKQLLQKITASLKPNCYILTREIDLNHVTNPSLDLKVVTIHDTDGAKMVLLRKTIPSTKSSFPEILPIKTKNFDWLPKLQNWLKQEKKVILFSENEPINGVLGLLNCLRKEAGGTNVICINLDQSAPKFDLNCEFYKEQLKKGLAVNIFQNGQWGTYRHLLLEQSKTIKGAPCYGNATTPGDLSSLTWIQSSLSQNCDKLITPVQVHYSALNFRDVMTASGRIAADVITKNRIEQMSLQGFEYSGVDETGMAVMGMTSSGCLATQIIPDRGLLWQVPQNWTLEEAATVPVVYSTCLYAMLIVGKLKPGDKILIHSGTGGVGQAAINIALHYKCQIFTTVGTEEKKRFILEKFPEIPESHIGNSRDTSFEQMVKTETDGEGVDLVLNSLAEEKLQASIRCLARAGRFLEIGKFDLASNNSLYLEMLSQGKSFNGIMLDRLFQKDPYAKKQVNRLLYNCIKIGMVKPLETTVFHHSEIEKAFRFMTTGKHMGKVLINLSQDLPSCFPRFYCNSECSTIILGGLGGFGLELADWLVLRGAKKIILTSRRGVTNGYQTLRMKMWKNYGAEIFVRTDDVTTQQGCRKLLEAANEIAPVENIFNLAVVLRDKTLENQTVEDFEISFAPKAKATQYLDKISRELCPNLRNFVVFSSVSCGRGNGGQTNYGMANSIMERICEERKKAGLPGLAIQWGAVGDVGLVAELMDTGNELVIGGTLQQKINNCLEVLDIVINQNEPIVSSMVVAEKRLSGHGSGIISAVAHILGLRDLKTVSLHTKLPEIGMDSMMAVEIKQTLEREYDVFLTPLDIRNLTFARLHEIVTEKEEGSASENHEQKSQEGLELLLRFVIDEAETKQSIIKMDTNYASGKNASSLFFLPGYEGTSTIFKFLSSKINVSATCFQYSFEDHEDTITDMARTILPKMVNQLGNSKKFAIAAHSFGTLVALELASMLEELGYVGKLILIDGAPNMTKELVNQQFPNASLNQIQITLLFRILTHIFPMKDLLEHHGALEKCETFEKKVNLLIERLPPKVNHSKNYQKALATSLYKRLLAMRSYKPSFSKIRAEVYLYKAKIQTISGLEEDFGLSELCHQKIQIKYFDGDHVSILDNQDIAQEINKQLQDGITDKMSVVKIEPPEVRLETIQH